MIFLAELAFKSDRLLGWDGDGGEFLRLGEGGGVSNPLGWDGDERHSVCIWRYIRVSNPLGWDGDCTRHLRLTAQQSTFLIH